MLQDLGYELADMELADGWLIFEESSAERIVRQWLIPWFAPGLGRLRTIGANGVDRILPLMQDFKEMFLFAHREPMYRDRSWVIVDGEPRGRRVISDLRSQFPSWQPDRFRHWEKDAFEYYYPEQFQEQVNSVFRIGDGRKRQQAKIELLKGVLRWIEEDESRARDAFRVSAAEVIEKLRDIRSSQTEMSEVITPDPPEAAPA